MVDSFFLGTSTRLFGAGQGGEGVVRGLYMQNNLGNSVELLGNFSKATNCLISGPSSPVPSPYFVPGLPHGTRIELRQALTSYQDYHMLF